MKFLGTGASEGTPNPFCGCRICENARKVGGKEIRHRSSFMVDGTLFIDFGADFFAQTVNHKINLDKTPNVLFTHMHFDHMNYAVFGSRLDKLEGCKEPLRVYLSDEAYSYVTDFLEASPLTEYGQFIQPDVAEFHKMEFGKKYKVGKYDVTALRGRHATRFEKNAANYLIEDETFSLYYAVDSGYFLDETFEALKGKELDVFVGECTFPDIEKAVVDETAGHMDVMMCLKNLDRLYENKTITDRTRVYLTHICPMASTHADFSDYIEKLDKPYKITVAYDGLEI